MEYYWIFRSTETLTPLSILKQMKNKIQIMIFQGIVDILNLSGYQIGENCLLNFLSIYCIAMICLYTETCIMFLQRDVLQELLVKELSVKQWLIKEVLAEDFYMIKKVVDKKIYCYEKSSYILAIKKFIAMKRVVIYWLRFVVWLQGSFAFKQTLSHNFSLQDEDR